MYFNTWIKIVILIFISKCVIAMPQTHSPQTKMTNNEPILSKWCIKQTDEKKKKKKKKEEILNWTNLQIFVMCQNFVLKLVLDFNN